MLDAYLMLIISYHSLVSYASLLCYQKLSAAEDGPGPVAPWPVPVPKNGSSPPPVSPRIGSAGLLSWCSEIPMENHRSNMRTIWYYQHQHININNINSTPIYPIESQFYEIGSNMFKLILQMELGHLPKSEHQVLARCQVHLAPRSIRASQTRHWVVPKYWTYQNSASSASVRNLGEVVLHLSNQTFITPRFLDTFPIAYLWNWTGTDVFRGCNLFERTQAHAKPKWWAATKSSKSPLRPSDDWSNRTGT